MEFGETSAPSTMPEPEEIEEKEKKHVKIRLSVFFDGTLNNRVNIEQREQNTEVYQANRKSIFTKKKDQSYENDYTNVEKIERYIETGEDDEYDKKLSIYIEGPGTEDEGGDDKRGYALGVGPTGIINKVGKGILDAIVEISRHVKATYVIDKITLDVYGFSRGAAGARNFIFEALKEFNSIREAMENKKRPVKKIEIDFAGLFDTVSSHGISFSNDTRTLKLHAIREAKKVVHLVAAEEHRKNFSLTNIKSAGGNGLALYLPGVHSDIGGGYRDEAEEEMVIYKTHHAEEAAAERERLIAAGWYRADEITLQKRLTSVHLQVKRSGIRHHYSRIPLHIMARFARENGVDVDGELESDEDIPEALSTIQARIEAYIARIGSASAEMDWQQNDVMLRQLRHDYLHFSAKYEIGLKPRFSADNDKLRKRMHYDG